MKKSFRTITALLVMVALAFSFVSCTDDSFSLNEIIRYGEDKKDTFAPLCFEAKEASILGFSTNGTASFESSVDGKHWEDWDGTTKELNVGDKLYVRAKGINNDTDNTLIQFNTGESESVGNLVVTGQIASLLSVDSSMCPDVWAGAFNSTFSKTIVSSVPKDLFDGLKLDYQGKKAFFNMFKECKLLESAPDLPFTETETDPLPENVYNGMFYGCIAIKEAPALPAQKVGIRSYANMFRECTSLTEAPALPAKEIAQGSYDNMFSNCTGLTTPMSELPATALAPNCYYSMFLGCTSLTSVPTIAATSVESSSCSNMFYGCIALEDISSLELKATELASKCYYSMFSGCKNIKKPMATLSATVLADGCYKEMFRNCSALEDLPVIADPVSGAVPESYKNMFFGAVKPGNLNTTGTGKKFFTAPCDGIRSMFEAPYDSLSAGTEIYFCVASPI